MTKDLLTAIRLKKKYCIIYIASKVPTWQGSRRNCDFSDLFPPLNEMDDRTSVY